jgi:hypothetical protein
VVRSSCAGVDRLVRQLGSSFALKELGQLHYVHGIEVHTLSSCGFLLSERKYAFELLLEAGLQKCAHMSTSMAASKTLAVTDGTPHFAEDSTRYRNIVGGLQYLTMTHPDFSFVTKNVCQYLHAPRCTHWSTVKSISISISIPNNKGSIISLV